MRQLEHEGKSPVISARSAALAVGLLVFLVFSPALRNGFVAWDDDLYVYRNPRVQQPTATSIAAMFTRFHASGNWHPLAELSHAADAALSGMRPAGHHLTSIALHALNAALVVLLALALARARKPHDEPSPQEMIAAVAAGLLWGLHPLRVEAAAWISERKEVLCAVFYLGGLLGHLRWGRDHRLAFYGLTLLSFALGLMSKPMAISFPFVLLVLDVYPLGRWGKRALVEKLPFVAMAAGSAALTLLAQHAFGAFRAMQDLSLATRVLIAGRSTVLYVAKMLWPTKLLPLYTYPQGIAVWRLALPALLLTTAVILVLWHRRRAPGLAAAFTSFLIALVPVAGIVQVGPQAMADRYTYLPSVAISLLAGAGIAWLWQTATRVQAWQRAALVLAIAAVPGILAAKSIRQTAVWHDDETLWTQALRFEPWSTDAYNNRASYYFEHGAYEAALADYTSALAYAPPVSPAHATRRRAAYLNDRAITYATLGRLDEALADANQAIALRPDYPDFFQNRGAIFQRRGDQAAATIDWQKARALTRAQSASPTDP